VYHFGIAGVVPKDCGGETVAKIHGVQRYYRGNRRVLRNGVPRGAVSALRRRRVRAGAGEVGTMNSYRQFARLYDDLIDQDYEKWVDYIEEIFRKFGAKPRLVLDLACGTGSVSRIMAQRGYEVIAADRSADMLAVAAEKCNGLDVRIVCQDMRALDLYGTVDAVVCTMDAVNYLLTQKDLTKTFSLIKNYLNPDGLFIFDTNTPHKLQNVLGDNTFVYDTKNVFYTWENAYNKKSRISAQYFTFFVKENGAYYRIDEVHRQRAFSRADVEKALDAAGLALSGGYGLFTFDAPEAECEKMVFVAKCFY
jgi:SAM-dependent methyltransferase